MYYYHPGFATQALPLTAPLCSFSVQASVYICKGPLRMVDELEFGLQSKKIGVPNALMDGNWPLPLSLSDVALSLAICLNYLVVRR